MSWRHEIEEAIRSNGREPTYVEILKELRSEWSWHNHVRECSQREMDRRKARFDEIQQEALKEMGEQFLNDNPITTIDDDE
jgi:hypothetical protein